MKRIDGRAPNALRPVRITPNYLSFAEGSALIEMGKTWVLCAASVEDRVPAFRRGNGWLTAKPRADWIIASCVRPLTASTPSVPGGEARPKTSNRPPVSGPT